jgi:hypothetical protein
MFGRMCGVMPLLFIMLSSTDSQGMTEKTRLRIATDATAFLPETLRGMVLMHWEEVATAIIRQSDLKKQQPENYYWHGPGKEGQAAEAISREVIRAQEMIRLQRPFNEVFSAFGALAGMICESLNPLNMSDTDSQEIYYYSAFERYIEKSSPVFRIRFEGYRLFPVDQDKIAAEFKRRFNKLRSYYSPLTEEYRNRLAVGRNLDFDPTSIPFGVAMITYSDAVNAIIDTWCSLWKGSGGELENPPFDIVR